MVKGVTSVHFFFLPPLKIKIILRNPLLGKAVQTLENPFQRLFVDLGKGRPQRLSPACRWRFCGEGGLGEVALRGRRTPPCPCSVHSGCTSWPELRPGGETPGVTAPEGGPPGISEERVVQPVGSSWGTDLGGGGRPEHPNVKGAADSRCPAALTARLARKLARGRSSVRIPRPVLPVRLCLKSYRHNLMETFNIQSQKIKTFV